MKQNKKTSALTRHVYSLGLNFSPNKSRKLLYEPIKQFLEKHQYDVVHVHSGSISALAYIAKAARQSGISKIIVHSHASGIPSIKRKIIRFVFGFMLKKNATDFLACSKEAGIMKYPSKIVRNKLIIIRNGININEFRFHASKRKLIRDALGLMKDTFVLGHVGRFSTEKNHEYLVDVFNKVHENIPDSKLVLIGDGELRNEILLTVKALKLEESVLFIGNVDNVQDYYQAMDIFLLPSIYEGLPLVTIEAQASGLPCVISTGVSEAAKIANNVYRINIADKKSWIEKSIELRNTKRLDNSESIRQAGYDIKYTVRQIRELYFRNSVTESSGDAEDFKSDTKHENVQKESKLRVLEITGEPILHGGQEKFIQNLIENIDHKNLTIDVLTPYYCENSAFVQTVRRGW